MLIVKYTFFEAYKRKLLLLHAMVVIACVLIGLYAQSISITESSVSYIVFYVGFVRVCSVYILGVYLLVTENRNWEVSRVQNVLALPISRYELLIQKMMGYAAVVVLMTIVVVVPLLFVAATGPTLLWAATFLLELLIAMMMALMLSVLFQQPIFAIAIFSVFYVFARVAKEFSIHAQNILSGTPTLIEQCMAWPIKISAYLVPHFSQFANSSSMAYPAALEVPQTPKEVLLLQTVLYVALLFFISLAALRKKAF